LPTDHLNINSWNPTTGPHSEFWGLRFYDCTVTYDREFMKLFNDQIIDNASTYSSNVIFTSKAKPYVGKSETLFAETFEERLPSINGNMEKRILIQTTEGFGEIMTYRTLNCSHHKTRGFMIGLVTGLVNEEVSQSKLQESIPK